jgi:hypothetical protein
MGSAGVRLGFYSPRVHRFRKGGGFGDRFDLPYPMKKGKAAASGFGKHQRKKMERERVTD